MAAYLSASTLAAAAALAAAKAAMAAASSAADKTGPDLMAATPMVLSSIIVAPYYLNLPNAVINTSEATIGTWKR